MSDAHDILVFVGYKRPDYVRQVLTALQRCHGVEKYRIFAHIDGGGHPAIPDVVRELFPSAEIVKKRHNIGCNRNTLEAMEHGLTHSDFVVMQEDDILPSSDFLSFMEWGRRRFEDDPRVGSINAFSKIADLQRPLGWYMNNYFYPWGWGTWADRFRHLKNSWIGPKHIAWDIRLRNRHFRRVQRCYHAISPILSRTLNIGKTGGTWIRNETHWARVQKIEHWAGEVSEPQWSDANCAAAPCEESDGTS
jgi:hypothetical protein